MATYKHYIAENHDHGSLVDIIVDTISLAESDGIEDFIPNPDHYEIRYNGEFEVIGVELPETMTSGI